MIHHNAPRTKFLSLNRWKFKISKSWTLEDQNLKLAVGLQNIKNSKLNDQIPLNKLKLNQKSYYYLQNSAFWGRLSMESQPKNPKFRSNPENFYPWTYP